MLRFCLTKLRTIARGPDTDSTGWLKSVLTRIKDTQENRELQQLLGR